MLNLMLQANSEPNVSNGGKHGKPNWSQQELKYEVNLNENISLGALWYLDCHSTLFFLSATLR